MLPHVLLLPRSCRRKEASENFKFLQATKKLVAKSKSDSQICYTAVGGEGRTQLQHIFQWYPAQPHVYNYTHLLDKTQHMMSRTLTDTSEDRGTGTEWVHNRTSIGNRKKKGKSVPFVLWESELLYTIIAIVMTILMNMQKCQCNFQEYAKNANNLVQPQSNFILLEVWEKVNANILFS